MAKPNVLTISGINPTIPNIIADKPATIAVVPALNDNANADIPVAINPRPAPNVTAATPNKAHAPATINKSTATPFNKYPATPRIVNAAPNATKDLRILSQLIDPRIFKPMANTTKELAAIINEPAPARAPFTLLPIIFIAATNIAKDPSIAVRDLPISDQLRVDNIFNAPPSTTKDIVAPNKANDFPIAPPLPDLALAYPPLPIIFIADLFPLFKKFIANTNIAKAPPIAVKPRPISPQLIEPSIFNAPARTIIEFANTSKAIPLLIARSGSILLSVFVIILREIIIVTKLFTISVNFILPSCLSATDIINNDKDNVINPFVFFLVLPSSGNKCIVAVKTPIAPAKPIKPVII